MLCVVPFAAASGAVVLNFADSAVAGYFSTSYQKEKSNNENSEDRELMVNTLEINHRWLAQGYIWKPWFSAMNLNVLTVVRQEQNGFDERNSETNLLGDGSAELMIYPGSRFPFTAKIRYTDTRVQDDGAGNNTQTSRFIFQQNYSPLHLNDTYSLRLSHFIRDEEISGDSQQTSVNLLAHHLRGNNELETSLEYENFCEDENILGLDANDYSDIELYMQHNFNYQEKLVVKNTINYFYTEDEYDARLFEQQVVQLSSTAFFRPESKDNLTLNSLLRVHDSNSKSNESASTGKSNESASTGVSFFYGQVGSDYQYSPFTRIYTTFSWELEDNAGEQTTLRIENVGINYRPSEIVMGEFNYNWFASGFFEDRDPSEQESSVQTLVSSIGHTISSQIGDGNMLSHASQSVSVSGDSDDEAQAEMRLTHRLSLKDSYRDNRVYSMWQLSYDDIREYGEFDEDESIYQLLTAQFTRNSTIDVSRVWTGNLTAQLEIDDDKNTDKRTDLTYSGDISYQNYRFLNVQNLTMSSRLFLTSRELLSFHSRAKIDDDGSSVDSGSRTEVRLDWQLRYTIGQLEASFLVAGTKVEDSKHMFISVDLRRFF